MRSGRFDIADEDQLRASPFPGGAAVTDGTRGWVLLDDAPERNLGRVLAWADQRSYDQTHVIAEAGAGTLARRASLFRQPPIVWHARDTVLEPARPDPPAVVESPPEAALDLVHLLTDAGLDIVIEQGMVRGEVLGLEVARVIVDEAGTARVEVGVGRHDRDAFTMVHGHLPPSEALASVVDSVRRHRRADAVSHPLGRLVPERWLRAAAIADPALVGAVALEPVEAVFERESVKDTAPAIAMGTTESDRPIVVAFSVGIDLDLVPAAADARLTHAPDADLALVVPSRDDHPVVRRLAASLAAPASIVVFDGDFRRTGDA